MVEHLVLNQGLWKKLLQVSNNREQLSFFLNKNYFFDLKQVYGHLD